MFTTTVSEIKQFWACPTRWYLMYVHPRRKPRSQPTALTAGTAWHEFMESLLNNTPREKALAALEANMRSVIDESISEGWIAKADDLEKELERLLIAGELWKDWLPCETLGVEEAFELLIPAGDTKYGSISPQSDLRILGRLDRQIRLNDTKRIGHYQHRTRGGSKPVAPYLDTFHRNPHEGVYWAMMEEKFNEEPFGTVLSLLRKLSIKTIREKPETALQTHLIPITKEQAYQTVRNVIVTCNQMTKVANGGQIWDNPDMDMGRYDNSIDPFFEALSTGDLDLLNDDTKFMDTEDRYSDIAEAVE